MSDWGVIAGRNADIKTRKKGKVSDKRWGLMSKQTGVKKGLLRKSRAICDFVWRRPTTAILNRYLPELLYIFYSFMYLWFSYFASRRWELMAILVSTKPFSVEFNVHLYKYPLWFVRERKKIKRSFEIGSKTEVLIGK